MPIPAGKRGRRHTYDGKAGLAHCLRLEDLIYDRSVRLKFDGEDARMFQRLDEDKTLRTTQLELKEIDEPGGAYVQMTQIPNDCGILRLFSIDHCANDVVI